MLCTHILVPRPLHLAVMEKNDFSPQLRDKIWEWPGNEAIVHMQQVFGTDITKFKMKGMVMRYSVKGGGTGGARGARGAS